MQKLSQVSGEKRNKTGRAVKDKKAEGQRQARRLEIERRNGTEKFRYINVMKGEASEDSFMSILKNILITQYVEPGAFPPEDVPAMMKKLYRSLFQFYVLQDLIDDPNITDIKVTGPHEIRTRYKGKAYISNITFIDEADYIRFIDGICYKNGISQKIPQQTFTDTRDKNYILRLSLSAKYINSVPYIRQLNEEKERRAREEREEAERRRQEEMEKERQKERQSRSAYSGYTGFIFFHNIKNEKQLNKEYRRLAKRFHPDSPNGDSEKFVAMQKEYERLKKNLNCA